MTGTAAWMLRVVLDHMLEVQADYEGLRIKPCIPSDWKEYMVKRTFRGDTYVVTVKNPDNVQTGIKKMFVDGQEVSGSLIKPFGDAKTHVVEVIMG